MTDSRTAPYASLLLRTALGILFLAHFSLKFFVFTPAGTAKFCLSRSARRAGLSHHGG